MELFANFILEFIFCVPRRRISERYTISQLMPIAAHAVNDGLVQVQAALMVLWISLASYGGEDD